MYLVPRLLPGNGIFSRLPPVLLWRGGASNARVPRRERGNEIEATRLLAVSFLQSFFLQLAECIDAESLFRGFLALFDQIAACESDLFVLVLGHHVVPIGEASV